ncbi:MAG: hypothetical protein JSU82_16125 [Rhodospirillales bacterium]|nr:MAG: hypothetical protein JSU82_16125 [Rhodospirillales bacterium]
MTNANSAQVLISRFKRHLAIGILAGLLAACSGVEPISYTPIDQIPPGPGLFSGEDGVFTLYESGRRDTEDDADD